MRFSAVLTLVGLAACQDYPEVSRLGKNILMLQEVSTPGYTTPKVLFNKVANVSDEPRFTEQLTALGQRQQYIVGGEYRLRYVEEAQLLNYSFDITQLWIQATFDSKSILSSQAQLHGLYPPSTNINFLNDWQQRNAVPPLDNVLNDQWTTWQQELGNKALPYGFNTFPINVQGHEDDFLLHTDGQNCPKFNASFTAGWPDFEKKTKATFGTFMARLSTLFGSPMDTVSQAMNACDYLSWAYYHDIALTFAFTDTDVHTCDSLTVAYYNYFLDVDQSLGYLGANQYLRKLLDQLKAITGQLAYEETFFYTTLRPQDPEQHLVGAAASDGQPHFFFYTTEQVHMRQLLSALMGSANRATYPQVFQTAPLASLQFAIEVVQANDGSRYVQAHLGDNDVVLGGCTATKCDIEAFKTYLGSVATLDVPTACANKQMQLYQ